MIIALPKESKVGEGRVALTPEAVESLVKSGHQVRVQKNAGLISFYPDALYQKAGAKIAADFKSTVKGAQLIIKVKEPTEKEVPHFTKGQILFTYLHLASNPKLTQALLKKKIVAIGYETVEMSDRSLPLLKPMSAIAGRLATQVGAYYLKTDQGGKGRLMGGIEGVSPARVLILGAGTVGINAARNALGLGADVTILDKYEDRLEEVWREFAGTVTTALSTEEIIRQQLPQTDLLVGSVLIAGAKAPKLVTRSMLKLMQKGSVIVDVAVDQGGCVESSKPTTHANPIFIEQGIIHYGVTNMPGSVPVSATQALVNATLPYVLSLANHGLKAFEHCEELKKGVNLSLGKVVHPQLKYI